VEGDELDRDRKNKFNKQELKAILRIGAEKLFRETGPTTDDGLVGSTMNGGISTGAPDLWKIQRERKAGFWRLTTLTNSVEHAGGARRRARSSGAEHGRQLPKRSQWADFDPSMTMKSLKKKVRTAIGLMREGKNSG
jgi:hypothetical protein